MLLCCHKLTDEGVAALLSSGQDLQDSEQQQCGKAGAWPKTPHRMRKKLSSVSLSSPRAGALGLVEEEDEELELEVELEEYLEHVVRSTMDLDGLSGSKKQGGKGATDRD